MNKDEKHIIVVREDQVSKYEALLYAKKCIYHEEKNNIKCQIVRIPP
jgi:hypothetical protein